MTSTTPERAFAQSLSIRAFARIERSSETAFAVMLGIGRYRTRQFTRIGRHLNAVDAYFFYTPLLSWHGVTHIEKNIKAPGVICHTNMNRLFANKYSIVSVIKNSPTSCLTNVFDDITVEKIKDTFGNTKQQLFLATVYCFLNHAEGILSFVINFDDVWEWIGCKNKAEGRLKLTQLLNVDIDYTATQLGVCGEELIMINRKALRELCIYAFTKQAIIMGKYFTKLDGMRHEMVCNRLDEMRQQLQDNNCQQLRESTVETVLFNYYKPNKRCVYIGVIDNKSDDGEPLVLIGSSDDLEPVVGLHKDTYENFRLIAAFDVFDHAYVEAAVKKHPKISPLQRTIMVNDPLRSDLFVTLPDCQISAIIEEIIATKAYDSPENYAKAVKTIQHLQAEVRKYKKETAESDAKMSELTQNNNMFKRELSVIAQLCEDTKREFAAKLASADQQLAGVTQKLADSARENQRLATKYRVLEAKTKNIVAVFEQEHASVTAAQDNSP